MSILSKLEDVGVYADLLATVKMHFVIMFTKYALNIYM